MSYASTMDSIQNPERPHTYLAHRRMTLCASTLHAPLPHTPPATVCMRCSGPCRWHSPCLEPLFAAPNFCVRVKPDITQHPHFSKPHSKQQGLAGGVGWARLGAVCSSRFAASVLPHAAAAPSAAAAVTLVRSAALGSQRVAPVEWHLYRPPGASYPKPHAPRSSARSIVPKTRPPCPPPWSPPRLNGSSSSSHRAPPGRSGAPSSTQRRRRRRA